LNTLDVMLQDHWELGMLWMHNVVSCQNPRAFNKWHCNMHQKVSTSFAKYTEVGLLLKIIGG
jgi:hypothetical protein